MLRPVYTEAESCQDCYKCVRECPVKAISVEDNRASIIDERCVFCGHCTQICPTGAKKVRDGLTRARFAVERSSEVYLSLAPSYISEFGDCSPEQLIAAIRSLGFKGVSETALGAELVTDRTENLLESPASGIHISSACPVVVSYICKYSVSHSNRITPVLSPMLAHAKMLKHLYGESVKVIFAGPCIAKKSEADRFPELVDVSITFRDLREWLDMEAIDPKSLEVSENDCFIPYPSRSGSFYPIEGGMLESFSRQQNGVRYMSFSDLGTVQDVFSELDEEGAHGTLFLELLACRGGCINGPSKLNSRSPVRKRESVVNNTRPGDLHERFASLDLSCDYPAEPCNDNTHTEEEIMGSLAAVGKTTIEDELNCSGCGYDTCRDFAVAMLDGRAEENMCVSYMRRIAHDKATVLLQKIPAGVVMVNEELEVVDMNRAFAAAMGDETAAVFDIRPGMEGASLERISSFASLFKTALVTGEEIREQRVSHSGSTYLLSVYNIQPHHLVFGLLQDLHDPTVQKEWMMEQTSEVIRNHMATVQEVARLLGENAAFTDTTLRSVIDSLSNDDKES